MPSRLEVRITRGAGSSAQSRSATSNPSKSGNCTSTSARSGRCVSASWTAAGAVSGLGHDDEAAPLEQLSRSCAEGAVVVDDEHAPVHGRIVPAVAAHGSVASPTLSAAVACRHAGRLVSARIETVAKLRRAPLLSSTLAAAGSELRAHPIVIGDRRRCRRMRGAGAAAIERASFGATARRSLRFTILAGVSFVAAGLVASSRRRERWTGALMVGAGFALFAGTLVAGEPLAAVHGRAGCRARSRPPCWRISSSPFRTAGSIRAGSASSSARPISTRSWSRS